jgi:hypothetical protein
MMTRTDYAITQMKAGNPCFLIDMVSLKRYAATVASVTPQLLTITAPTAPAGSILTYPLTNDGALMIPVGALL